MRNEFHFIAASAVFVCIMSPVEAGGWIPVRVNDGVTSHCINRTTEAITLDVRRLVVNKDVSWFTEDAKVDLLLSVSLGGATSTQTGKKTFSLPRAYSASLQSGGKGWYSAGIEESVFNSYALKDGNDQVTNAHVDITIVNEKGKTALADVALSLLDITKSLPIPAGPFSSALEYADKYANGIMSKLTENSSLKDDILKTGSIQLNFGSSSSSCNGTSNETTGTIALVRIVDKPDPANGFPDLYKINDYCFRVSLSPSYGVRYQTRPASGVCPIAGSGWTDLKSPHVAFMLNADDVTAPPPNSRAPAIVTRSPESLARCRANGKTCI